MMLADGARRDDLIAESFRQRVHGISEVEAGTVRIARMAGGGLQDAQTYFHSVIRGQPLYPVKVF